MYQLVGDGRMSMKFGPPLAGEEGVIYGDGTHLKKDLEYLDKIRKLADQIEKMKCCGNCQHVRVGRDQDLYCYCDGYTVSHNTSCTNWEFNE